MRRDYAADKREADAEHASREGRSPRATALLAEIEGAPWDVKLADARGWAYSECRDAISSLRDLTPGRVVELRDLCDLPEGR